MPRGRRDGWLHAFVLSMIAVVVVAVELGAGFTGASATVQQGDDSTMVVDLEVTVPVGAGPVVAHLELPGDEEHSEALVERSPGVWGTSVEVRRADWHVVFESLSTGSLSEAVPLSALGLDTAVPGPGGSGAPGPGAGLPTGPVRPWGALSVACAAAAAVLAGFAVVPGGRSSRPRHLRRRSLPRRSTGARRRAA